MKTSENEKPKPKIRKELIIKELGYYVTGDVDPVAKGLCYDHYFRNGDKISGYKFVSKST